ncbi:MAG: hypothetical protein WA876_13030 [Candidatus Acidiferrales bacterium]
MIRSLWRRSYPVTAALAAASLIILLSGCGVPLAPGYQIQKEALTVHFVAGSPPHLAVRAEYRLANVGNAPLHFIGVELPGEKSFGRANVHAEIDGKEITLQHNPHEATDDWRVPFPVPWRPKEKANLTFAYDLSAQSATDPRIFAAANAFYLNDSGWLPALMGFKAFLSPSIVRPNPTDLSVMVPADFRVTASGQLHGTKKRNGEIEYRFRIRKADFDPFVVAGQYNEQRAPSANVVFWSAEPLPADWQQSASALGQTLQFYARVFGSLPRDNSAIYAIDASARGPSSPDPKFPAETPPTTIFISQPSGNRPLAANVPSLPDDQSLAATWFSHLLAPRPEAWLLANGLSVFAALAEQQHSNVASRGAQIFSVLDEFDEARKQSVERPITNLSPSDSPALLRIAQSKIVLFLFALEDKCGAENVRHAVSDMVYALRGQEYGYSDFRAALEQQCHQDLADLFHTWLARPGIPPDFRARYENAGAGKH